MKLIFLAIILLLTACSPSSFEMEVVHPDGDKHNVKWPSGECNGKPFVYGVRANEWAHAASQFGVRCDDGRTIYNLTNFTVDQ